MSSSPVVTYRNIAVSYDINTLTYSVVANIGILIGLGVDSIENMVPGESVTVDTGDNQETVEIVSVTETPPSFSAVFSKYHLLQGIPVVGLPLLEPQWGQGQNNFVADINAVALLITTRLRMFQGEWWANQLDGLPLWQQILAKSQNTEVINTLITQRILNTPYVTGPVTNLEASFNPQTRQFLYSATVQTQFGQVQVSNVPTPPSQALP